MSEVFDGSWGKAVHESIIFADNTLGNIPSAFTPNQNTFGPIYETHRDHWGVIMHGDQMVAKWALPFIIPEDEAHFRAGTLIEADLSIERIHMPLLPGSYFGYCPILAVSSGHQAASTLLLSSFIDFLESQAHRGVILRGIGAISCSASGEQVCRDLGMTFLCHHQVKPSYGVWELTGEAIATSIFARRSAFLKQVYSEEFGS